MKNGNRISAPTLVSLVASLAALAISGAVYMGGGRGGASVGGVGGGSAADLARMEAAVDGLRKRIDGLRAAYEFEGRGASGAGRVGVAVAPGAVEGSGLDTDRLARLEGVVERAGLDKLASSGQLDPEFLESMHSDYASRKQVSEYRFKVLARNEAQHQADAQKYDAKTLTQLYDVARGQNQDSDKAMTVLMEQFPEANATGMALAERALQAAMQADTASVEEYYTALVKSGAFGDVVTDMGIEAVPSLQHYLIGQYLKEGRVQEAETLLNQLAASYTTSFVADRGRSGEPEWYPVNTLVENLKQEIANASAGGAVGATSGRSPGQAVGMPGGQSGSGPGATPSPGGAPSTGGRPAGR